jgi:hypothetical protein
MREFAQTQKPAPRASFAHPARSKSIRIQPKLKIGAAGDTYEQEADRVADHVMRMPELGLQRACACGGGCPRCQSAQHAHAHVQTKSVQANDGGETAAPPIVHEVLNSPGLPLDPTTRAFFEPRFGHDFSQVRVHSDAQADWANRNLAARAFTLGRDIVFRHGEHDPQSDNGKRLLAHELAHTIQGGEPHQIRRQHWPTPPKFEGLDPESNPAAGAASRARLKYEQGKDFTSQETLTFGQSVDSPSPVVSPSAQFSQRFLSTQLPQFPMPGNSLFVVKPSLSATYAIKYLQDQFVTVSLGDLSTILQNETTTLALQVSQSILQAKVSALLDKSGAKISTAVDLPTLGQGFTVRFQTEPKPFEVKVGNTALQARVRYELALEFEINPQVLKALAIAAGVIVTILLLPEEVLVAAFAGLIAFLDWLAGALIGLLGRGVLLSPFG